MSGQPRLHHLLDRMLRGVLLEAEREQLVGLVGELDADIARYEEVVGELNEANTGLQRDAADLQSELNTQRWYAEDRLRTGRLQRQRAETAEAEVARLTAGQCTHHVGMCTQHHTTPVDGCPYPKCKTARERATCETCGAPAPHLPHRYMKGAVVDYCRGELTPNQPPTAT